MALTGAETLLLAYFLAEDALAFSVDGRFYRREEFYHVFKDRLYFLTPRAADGLSFRHAEIARELVDLLIEKQAILTIQDKLAGPLHQFAPEAYKAAIKSFAAQNQILASRADKTPQFWAERFAALREDPAPPA